MTSVRKKEGRLREIGTCWRWGLGLLPPVLNRPCRKKLTSSICVKEVKLSMGCLGTEGTDSSLTCVISLGPHSSPIRAGTVVIHIKLRPKLPRLKGLGNSGGIPATVMKCSWLTGHMSLRDC